MTEPLSNTELSSSKTLDPTNRHDSTSESHQTAPEEVELNREDDVVPTAKRKRNDGVVEDRLLHPLWKTSLCSYFRSHNGSCSHGGACRYAHGEEELRLRPDNTWDPTSERAKKALKTESDDKRAVSEEVMMTEAVVDDGDADGDDGCGANHALSKCLVHLPRKWSSENFRTFLSEQGIAFKHAKKKKGMMIGFVTFEDEEQLKSSTKELEGKSIGNKTVKVADVLPRSFEKKSNASVASHQELDEGVDVASSGTLDGETNNDNLAKTRNVRDAVTPLAHMAYADQLEQKKSALMLILKKLTRNARKACPNGVSLPEWILKSREIGGLPCKLEGIIASPIVNGYRNKCEFSVGYSLGGKVTVGFMLGNFREGVTAVEEAVDCPNVSTIACKYATIFQEFLQDSDLPVWNRFKNTGFWRQLTVREGRTNGNAVDAETFGGIAEVMLIVQVSTASFDDAKVAAEFKRLAQAFVVGATSHCSTLPLTALVVQDHQGISNVAPADAPLHLLPIPKAAGDSEVDENNNAKDVRIHDYVNNLQFSISPTAFFQVNTLAAEKLYSLAGDWACLGPDTLLFDICCGTGTIGLTLAHRVGMVIGIEMNASAVSDAHRNAEINGIKNIKFICSKAEDVMGSLLREHLNVTKEQVDDPNISGKGNDSPEDSACPEPENGELASHCPENNNAEVGSEVQKGSTCEQADGISEQAEDVMGSLLRDDANMPKEQSDYPNISGSGNDIPEDSTFPVPENGETTSHSESNNAEVGGEVQKGSTSRNGKTSLQQFKNVVAIVDPPRAGLHPTVIKALRTHPGLRRLVYISCNPETLVANAIELCTPSPLKIEKGNKDNRGWRNMSSAGLARHRAKSMPISEAFHPVKAMAVDLFPHTPHCELVMLLER
ncbi:zinc finger CCCH domain-containing protein 24-like [Glycine soja]|uniref:Zinc finger CCCH domain-containing protein 24 isoform A n=1 Tax=Glycine soja TaxID=3848 RepID=A0A445I2Z9_GLYSO|nr:zinc finger CCCH domain-containing protein 24-like [Glycine soja]RZB80520.1 Zinc finger CCCH domain-containing protein 24 isoform A [Glycine soja]